MPTLLSVKYSIILQVYKLLQKRIGRRKNEN